MCAHAYPFLSRYIKSALQIFAPIPRFALIELWTNEKMGSVATTSASSVHVRVESSSYE